MILLSFFLLPFLFSCQENNVRVDVWKYRRGQEEIIVKDTIVVDNGDFNNPYLGSIIFIDSIMSNVNTENLDDTEIKYDNSTIRKSRTIKVGSENYKVFRGEIYGEPRLHENVNFIYMEGTGVIALHIYGYGYMKLISRSDSRRSIEIDEMTYDKILNSDTLFPVDVPDTLKVYDIEIE